MTAIRVHTVSLGCPKNRVDTERLLGVLGEDLVPAEGVGDADLVLVNTCGFIRPAVEESVDTIVSVIREAEEAQAAGGRRPLVAVAGCMVSRYGRADLARDLPEVDLWLSTRELEQWPALLGAALGGRKLDGLGPRRLSTAPGLRLPQNQRGLLAQVRLLHHPVHPRPPREPAPGRAGARGAPAGGAGRRARAGRRGPGRDRLRPRPGPQGRPPPPPGPAHAHSRGSSGCGSCISTRPGSRTRC